MNIFFNVIRCDWGGNKVEIKEWFQYLKSNSGFFLFWVQNTMYDTFFETAWYNKSKRMNMLFFGGRFLVFFSFFLKILEGGQLEFWNFIGGLFSQKKEILTSQFFFWKFQKLS